MKSKAQAGIETMGAISIILFVMVITSLLIIDRNDQTNTFSETWKLELECRRFSNAVYEILTAPPGARVTYESLDVNLVVRSQFRGLETQRDGFFAICALPGNNIVNASNQKAFTIPEFSDITVKRVGRRVRVTYV